MDARESELCRALLDTYLTRDTFEELLDDIDKRLNDIVESTVDLRVTVRRVVRRVSRKVFSADHEGFLRPRTVMSRVVSCFILRMVAAIFV